MKVGPRLRLEDILDYLSGRGRPVAEKVFEEERRDALMPLDSRWAIESATSDEWLSPTERELKRDRTLNPDAFQSALTEWQENTFKSKHHPDEILYEFSGTTPAAIVSAFAKASDPQGRVDRLSVQKALGERAAALFDTIAQELPEDHDEPTVRPLQKYSYFDEATKAKVAASLRRPYDLARMPALAAVTKALGGSNALEGFSMAAIQHLFPTTPALFDALGQNGLDPARTIVMGKPYSTDPDVLAYLEAQGTRIGGDSQFLYSRPAYENVKDMKERAFDELSKLFHGVDPTQETKRRFLLLDEGGALVRTLHEKFPDYAALCVAVEQTDHGIQELEGLDLKCPVISVARSEAKKLLEAPMIGASIVSQIHEQLAAARPGGLAIVPKQAAVIGYGAVGKATAKELTRAGYQVFVYDIDETKMAEAVADGLQTGSREEVLKHGHLLVSATGKEAVPLKDYELLPTGAVMANAGSGNHELGFFDRFGDKQWKIDFVTGEAFATLNGVQVSLGEGLGGQDQLRHLVYPSKDGTERLVLRGGFVVNMSHDIPPEYIQLTRALLLGAILQAAGTDEPGITALREDVQQVVVDATRGELKRYGLTLESPDFSKLSG